MEKTYENVLDYLKNFPEDAKAKKFLTFVNNEAKRKLAVLNEKKQYYKEEVSKLVEKTENDLKNFKKILELLEKYDVASLNKAAELLKDTQIKAPQKKKPSKPVKPSPEPEKQAE